MVEAKFLIKKEDESNYICNICTDEIDNDKIIGLKCNSKHIYCYECINDWYKELTNKNNYGNYSLKTMCPICRKNGGKLPLHPSVKYHKSYHIDSLQFYFKSCKATLKNGNNCSKNAKYGKDYCGTHVNYCVPIKVESNNEQNNETIKKCDTLLKNGKGLCCNKGLDKYNGLCGRHFVKDTVQDTVQGTVQEIKQEDISENFNTVTDKVIIV
jgi:hypothetical protein